MGIDSGLDFEYFMQFEIAYKLNVSPSKQVALRIEFSRFADTVRPLAKKAPKEFEFFMEELEKTIDKIERWRAPKGKVVGATIYGAVNGQQVEYWPNGKLRYKLWDKPLQR